MRVGNGLEACYNSANSAKLRRFSAVRGSRQFLDDAAPARMTLPDIRERLSPNHGSRGEAPNIRAIDMLVQISYQISWVQPFIGMVLFLVELLLLALG